MTRRDYLIYCPDWAALVDLVAQAMPGAVSPDGAGLSAWPDWVPQARAGAARLMVQRATQAAAGPWLDMVAQLAVIAPQVAPVILAAADVVPGSDATAADLRAQVEADPAALALYLSVWPVGSVRVDPEGGPGDVVPFWFGGWWS